MIFSPDSQIDKEKTDSIFDKQTPDIEKFALIFLLSN